MSSLRPRAESCRIREKRGLTQEQFAEISGFSQQYLSGLKIVRTIGIARARFKIGMMNLGYNIRRLVQLERLAAVPA